MTQCSSLVSPPPQHLQQAERLHLNAIFPQTSVSLYQTLPSYIQQPILLILLLSPATLPPNFLLTHQLNKLRRSKITPSTPFKPFHTSLLICPMKPKRYSFYWQNSIRNSRLILMPTNLPCQIQENTFYKRLMI